MTPGDPRHTNRTTTVASFRTWRGLRPSVARSPEPITRIAPPPAARVVTLRELEQATAAIFEAEKTLPP